MFLKRLLKYFVSTLLGTGTDVLILWVLSDFVFHDYVGQVLISPLISFEFAVVVNFTTAFFFVWKERVPSKTKKSFFGHLWKFNLSFLTSFVIKMLLLVIIQKVSGWDVVVCNMLALCISGMMNFLLSEKVVFKNKKAIAYDDTGNN